MNMTIQYTTETETYFFNDSEGMDLLIATPDQILKIQFTPESFERFQNFINTANETESI